MTRQASPNTQEPPTRNLGDIVFVPLGGCGEIGMNVYLYGVGPANDRQWLMVDFGVKFGDERDPGIDVILPDISFIEDDRRALQGIVLTHAHEDHFGAVPHLWSRLKVPVFATPFAASLLRRKIGEAGLEDELRVNEIGLEERFVVGRFECEFLSVTHSIPEANAVVIRSGHRTIVHSGDWKIDDHPVIGEPIDERRLRTLREEGCDVFVCDSTNVLRDGTSPSESDVAAGLAEVIASAKKRVAVTMFASNLGRVASIAKAAAACERHVVIVGRALRNNIQSAQENGYLQDLPEFHDEENFGYIPRERVLCICTGSQGEMRAALARIANGSHPRVEFEEGDMVVFSSRTIPGNEKAVSAVQNALASAGIEIVTADDAPVHVTGHPRRDELRQMYEWLKPALVIPMHGEARHLWEQARFAKACGIADSLVVRNGDVARLFPAPATIVDEVPFGRLHVDGRVIVPSFNGPARERRKLSFNGVVAVSLVVDRDGELEGDVEVAMIGLPETGADGQPLEEMILDVVEDVFDVLPRAKRRNDDVLEEFVYQAVRRGVERQWGKKPMCAVSLHRL